MDNVQTSTAPVVEDLPIEDDIFELGEDVPAEEPTEQETQTEEPKAEEKATGLRVTYNGEEKILSDAEAVEYAQKGMNYTKIKSQLDELKNGEAREAMELVRDLADAQGMSIKDYRAHLRQNMEETMLRKELEKIIEASPDIADDLAHELAKSRIASRISAQKSAREQNEAKPWETLVQEYPDIKGVEDIPEDVREAIGGGKDPLLAMREHEIASLKKQIETMRSDQKAKEQNERNKQSALGKVSSTADGKRDEIADILLSGIE